MNSTNHNSENGLLTVTGSLSGAINGIEINGTVTGTADSKSGHVANVYHNIDPAIGPELSRIVLAQTILCAGMAIERDEARNLNSLVPMQKHQRLCTFSLPSHEMRCEQTVEWIKPTEAVVTMAFSGSLPSFSDSPQAIPDVRSKFHQTGPSTIQQNGSTEATFDGKPLPLNVEIEYVIYGPKMRQEKPILQILENANNTSSYDKNTRQISFKTDVLMMQDQ